MKRIAIIENGVVTNVCVFPVGAPDEEITLILDEKMWVEVGPEVGIGSTVVAGVPQPLPGPALSEIKAGAWDRIKAERDRRTQAGGYQVAGKWYHSDTFSRAQQMGLVLLGANIPAGTRWKTMDGSFVDMTPALASQIFAAAAANDIAIFSAAEAHKAAMEASANPAAYDFSAGWPAMFEAQA